MDRAWLIVSLAADQARDEATKAWLQEQEGFLALARYYLYRPQPWWTFVPEDVINRHISILVCWHAVESMLAKSREDVATLLCREATLTAQVGGLRLENDTLRGKVHMLDERVGTLLNDNQTLIAEFAQRGVDEARDAELDALTQRMDEDMCITCDVREAAFERLGENAA